MRQLAVLCIRIKSDYCIRELSFVHRGICACAVFVRVFEQLTAFNPPEIKSTDLAHIFESVLYT